MLPILIKLLLYLIDLVGFFNESAPQTILHKFRYACASVSFLFFLSTINYYNWTSTIDLAEQINNYIQVYGGLFTYFLAVIDVITFRRQHRIFWIQFQKSHTLFGQHQTYYKWNQIIFKFIVLFVLYCVNLYLTLTEIPSEYMIETFVVIIVIRVCHIRIIQYLIYVEIIRTNIKEMQLKAIEATILLGVVKELLKEVRAIHQMTIIMVDCLHTIFGYSQFAVVLFCFFQVLTDLNSLYLGFNPDYLVDIAGEYIVDEIL